MTGTIQVNGRMTGQDFEQAVFRLALDAGYEACSDQAAYDAGADSIMAIEAARHTEIEKVLKVAWEQIEAINIKASKAVEVEA
jgi:HJR/Mrr/RecB family endonuclease